MSLLSQLDWWQWAFLLLWTYRYTRLIGNIWGHWMFKSKSIPVKPSYTNRDVTVIIPTIHNNFEELRESLQSILACDPYELLLVTTTNKHQKLVNFVKTLESSCTRVFHVPIANKRVQVCEAIPKVKTSFIIMADDDVTWPRTILPWLLAPFEDAKVGGVGPCQRVKRVRSGAVMESVFNWLGAAYIERRNFEISATHHHDGGTSCMSGRTCVFRSEILRSPLFLEGFKTERWGSYQLNADDDNFITRWLVANQWKTWIQYNRECEIETTLENNTKFLYQCSRWARSNWRSNYTSLFTECHVWRKQPWSTYALHIATFTSLSFIIDPLIIYLTFRATATWTPEHQKYAVVAQVVWMAVTKFVKLIGLFTREPSDIIFWPVSVLFGYFHGFIKLYALFTLRQTSWGSRADGDTNDSHRMSPRARRSESITLPPGNYPGLIRYNDDKTFVADKPAKAAAFSDSDSEYDSDADSDESHEVYDTNDTAPTSLSSSSTDLAHLSGR